MAWRDILLVGIAVAALCLMIFYATSVRAECVGARDALSLADGVASCDFRIDTGAAGLQASRDCDDTTQEGFVVDFTYPSDGRASFSPLVRWIPATATSDFACWSAEAGCVTANGTLDGMSYGAAFYVTSLAPAALGEVAEVTISTLEVKNAAAGRRCRMRFYRQQTGCTDDMTGDARWLEVCW